MNRSLETGSHVIAKTSSPVTKEQSRLQLPMEVKSRTALFNRVAFNHMWLVSISVCLFELKCAINVKYTLDLEDIINKRM